MKSRFVALTLMLIILCGNRLFAQSVGDYVATTSGDYNTAANWSVSDGAGGFSGVATTSPTTSINVWIPEGKIMTSAAQVNAQNMHISGELNAGNFTIQIGTNANTTVGNLTVTSTGKLRSTNATAGTVNSLNIFGTTIQIDGQLGAANSNNFTAYNSTSNPDGGGGFRVYCMAVKANETTTVNASGTGKINVARFYGSSQTTVNANQVINVDIDVNILNNHTNSIASFGNFTNAGGSDRTINVNAGKIIRFTGGTPKSSMHRDAASAGSYTSGDFVYNIYGTLDMGKGTIRLSTSSTAGNVKGTYLNVKKGGTLVVGDTIRLLQGQASGQTCGLFPESGSTIKFGPATSVTQFRNNLGATNASFPTTYSNIILDNTAGLILPVSIHLSDSITFVNGKIILGDKNLTLSDTAKILFADEGKYIMTNGSGVLSQFVSADEMKLFPVGTSTSYNPATVKPTISSIFTIQVSDTLSGEVPLRYNYNMKEWHITPVTPSITEITLIPANSINTAITDVIGQFMDSTYSNVNAVKIENSYTATFSSFTSFVTGTSDIGTGNISAVISDLFVSKIGNLNMLYGALEGQTILVYNVGGQMVKQIISKGNQTEINLTSGVYIIKVDSKTLKVVL